MGGSRGRNRALRIALYHNHPPGGAAHAISRIGELLGERHELDVFTLSSAGEGTSPANARMRVFTYERRAPVRGGLYLNELRALQDIRALDRVNREVAAEIDAGRYDVVLASACRFAQAPPLLAYLRTPSAYFCHEPPRRFIDTFCRPEAVDGAGYARLRRVLHRPAQTLVERAWQRLDGRAVMAATAVVTNSAYTKRRIGEYYRREATVTYPGVDSARFAEGSRGGHFVLSVGAIEHHKGFDFLVRALSYMAENRRPPLVIAGGSANRRVLANLTELAKRSSVDLTVRIGVSDHELGELYRQAKAFVFGARLEPFGLVVLEAMAAGLPVVAVAEGGVPEAIEENVTGVLVERDELAFADALDRVLTDEREASRLGAAARRRVREAWTWEAAAARVEAALEGIARGARAEEAMIGLRG